MVRVCFRLKKERIDEFHEHDGKQNPRLELAPLPFRFARLASPPRYLRRPNCEQAREEEGGAA